MTSYDQVEVILLYYMRQITPTLKTKWAMATAVDLGYLWVWKTKLISVSGIAFLRVENSNLHEI